MRRSNRARAGHSPLALGDHLDQGILEEEAFHVIADVARRLVQAAPLNLGNFVRLCERTERQAVEQASCRIDRQVNRMVGKGRDLERQAELQPARMRGRGDVLERVVYVDHEIEKASRRQDASNFFKDLPGFLRVIDDIVAQDVVERSVRKGKLLAW